MLGSFFFEVSLGSIIAILLFLVWSVHFVFFRRSRSRYLNSSDRSSALAQDLSDQEHPQAFYRLFLYSSALALVFFRSLVAEPGPLYFRQVSLEEGGLAMLVVTYLALCILSFSLSAGSGQRKSGGAGQDFFTSVWLVSTLSPMAFLANNLVCFFLMLESVSAASMYLLIASRGSLSGGRPGPRSARQLAATVFFHFWSSFFSSVLFVYAVITFLATFGTTEWAYADMLLSLSLSLSSGPSSVQAYLAAYAVVLSVFVKLGASPFFFFKLEVYKGLPLLPLVFYSVFYFFSFNAIFFFLLTYWFPSLLAAVSPGLSAALLASVLYLGSAMFSLPLLRSFFAVSSVIGGALVVFLLLCFFF